VHLRLHSAEVFVVIPGNTTFIDHSLTQEHTVKLQQVERNLRLTRLPSNGALMSLV
jgi:hypothetical protein